MNWKKGKQKLVVLVDVNKKVYQVNLDKEKMNILISFLPQLFDDGVIKIIKEELPIKIGEI